MNKSMFEAVLEALQSNLRDHLPELNYGGCGMFVLTMGRILKANQIPFKIWRLTRPWQRWAKKANVKNQMRYLSTVGEVESSRGLADVHFIIEALGMLFDGHSNHHRLSPRVCRFKDEPLQMFCTHTLEEMQFIIDYGSWNERFEDCVYEVYGECACYYTVDHIEYMWKDIVNDYNEDYGQEIQEQEDWAKDHI